METFFFFRYQELINTHLHLCSFVLLYFGGDWVHIIGWRERERERMPLYDCMLLLKPHVEKASLMQLADRIGKHVYYRNGVLTDIKYFGKIYLGYGIKKRDGRHYQGHLMQMTMMATPNLNKELHYLNKEDRLLRWLLVKHRDTKYGMESVTDYDGKRELMQFSGSSIYNMNDDDYDDDEEEDDYEEYEAEEIK